MTETGLPQKFLIIALLLFFAAIVLAAVAGRLESPSLVVVRDAPPSSAPESAIARLMKEAAQKPADADLLARIASELLARNEMEAAKDFVRRALEADGQNANVLHLAGVVSHREGRHEEAAAYLEKSLASAESAATRYSLGVLYSHFLNDREKAAANFRKGLEAKEMAPGLKEALADELAKIGDTKAASPQ